MFPMRKEGRALKGFDLEGDNGRGGGETEEREKEGQNFGKLNYPTEEALFSLVKDTLRKFENSRLFRWKRP